ncbi:DnaD domain-containing protein [Bacillus sp. 1NLA3E]|uniref:DnaD domain-containing protein n=1 Tax=Bacillus sp. 1NLA3E TaxID=666686 RepID=UPI000247F4CC|nr:DnaD domain-containing protein [Bacillus sp. 1NLA3E]AGK54674.1 primosome subunit DnaD [Bacillus sp. 1NLA3E]
MNNSNMVAWLKNGNITIPHALLTNYKQMSLTEQEFVLILHVFSFLEKGNHFPTLSELSDRMTIDCTNTLRRLVQRGFIDIIEGFSEEGIRFEQYSLDPLWEKLIDQFQAQSNLKETKNNQELETDLYTCFEQEFGRPLSPFECESLGMWLDDDHHEPIIIKAALREAVISGKLNFRYIDRILFEWKKNGVNTIEQAKSYGRKFRQHQVPKQKEETGTKPTSVPFYNWLEK